MYKEIADFVSHSAGLHSVEPIDDLQEQIPNACLQALRAQVDLKRHELYKLSKQDAICKQVVDFESDWRREQLNLISDLIGDIPRYSIGTELRGDDDDSNDPGLSLEKLMQDIGNLPRIGIASSNSIADNQERDVRILNEYSNLRKELVNKCHAIAFGNTKIEETENKLNKIRHLLESIEEKLDPTENITDFFARYDGEIRLNLEEFTFLLEDAIKRSDTSPLTQANLKEMMKRVSI
ncbi:hypothetical protein HG535_0D04140 [Zygotorulaspora mrakii]|uniref:Uncharacterized protein n=1 Tax=Zygotorulaspora mrakii TaxID=42260 RepID=A0A7H9B2Q9_ZYGMR|nr:uncharacterized protein HG535_0D04140 [Zygotorulaspora mrakii]QLG72706.1 hypothetical protein HG535_0D04140 [Zygotorulaspora mrakii]